MVSVFWEYKRETRDARERFKSYLNTFGENRVAQQELLECLSIDECRVCLGKGQNICNNTSTGVILRSPGYRESWNVKKQKKKIKYIYTSTLTPNWEMSQVSKPKRAGRSER